MGCIAQSVTCLTADPGVMGLIPTQSHTFMEIDQEIISTAILLPSADVIEVVVSYRRKEKVWLGELTVPVDWDIKNQTQKTPKG